MAKKQKPIDAGPSKAYLVSFGDTMTALLAFFIVLNSLAKDQTGANMYSGTGSFINAFSKSGMPGSKPGNRSSDMIQQNHQSPVYALAENLDKNEDAVGPDDSNRTDRVIDREKENFQKFLKRVEKSFGLETQQPITNQVVFDSFKGFSSGEKVLSEHAIQIASELIPQLRRPNAKLEIIIWTKMPSRGQVNKELKRSLEVRSEIEELFWIKENMERRIRYTVKPWLFTDARRPVISFVMSKTREQQ